MPTPPTHYDDTAKGPGLAGLLEVARRRRVLALLPFLFVLTAAASLAIFLPSVWTTKTLVLVNRQQIPERFVAPTVQADIEARLLTLSLDIMTPERLMKIAEDYGLYPNLRRTQSTEDVVDRMRRDIRIELVDDKNDRRPREQRSVLFTMAYRAHDPDVAVGVTNTLASLYIQENGRLREKQAAGTTAFLEAQLADVANKLKTQEQRITEYKEKYLGELPEQRDTNVRVLERLQQQLQLASENSRRANERKQLLTDSLAAFDMTSGMVAGPGAGPNVTPADTAAARLNLLRQELAVMQTKFHDRYPDVIQMKDQIRILEAKVEAEKKAQAAQTAQQQQAAAAKKPARDLRVVPQNAYIQNLMTQLDQAQVDAKATSQEIADINRQIAVYQKRLENTPKREQELAVITRDYETTRELHRTLLSKRGEADMAAELEQRQQGETFRVIEPARMPEQPAGPNRFRLLLVGLALALGASGVAVLLAEQVDTSFRRVDEVRATAPIPVLSAIPRIRTEQDRYRQLRQRRWATAAVAVGLFVVAGTSFLVAHNNQSMVALLMPAQPTATAGR